MGAEQGYRQGLLRLSLSPSLPIQWIATACLGLALLGMDLAQGFAAVSLAFLTLLLSTAW